MYHDVTNRSTVPHDAQDFLNGNATIQHCNMPLLEWDSTIVVNWGHKFCVR